MSEHDHLVTMLNRLKLTALRDQLDSLVDEAGRRELTIRDALALFCEREIARRDQRRIDMSFGLARFPFVRDLASFDFGAQPSIDKAQVREIATGRFIANGEAVLLLGPPGSARRIWRWQSGVRQSWPATPCCSRRRRRWWRSWQRRSPTADWRSA
jgi:DNA replication protein DnaC